MGSGTCCSSRVGHEPTEAALRRDRVVAPSTPGSATPIQRIWPRRRCRLDESNPSIDTVRALAERIAADGGVIVVKWDGLRPQAQAGVTILVSSGRLPADALLRRDVQDVLEGLQSVHDEYFARLPARAE